MAEKIEDIREEFVSQWGAMGSSWGINRTMAQIHALLMVLPEPLTTDDVMEELGISRGNANTNLRELVSWGLVRNVVRRGERKEYFEAEKDVWKIFCTVSRERKRREIEPVLKVIEDCSQRSKKLKGKEADELKKMMNELGDFVSMADSVMDKISRSEKSKMMPLVVKMFK